MASKKSFDIAPIPTSNPLAEIHSNDIPTPPVPLKESIKPSPAPEEDFRVNQNFYVKKKFIEWIDTGRLEEKFRSKADFVDHILESYFKDKPYLKNK